MGCGIIAAPESMTAFPLVVRPMNEENVVGLLSRLADTMCAPYSAILGHMGIRADFMPGDEVWSRLAEALGLETSALAPMHRERVRIGSQSHGIRIGGHLLRPHLVVRGALRVCPTCLTEGRPILERWDVTHAPVCTEHGIRLVEECTCGRELSRRYRGTKTAFSCTCGKIFRELPVEAASPNLLDMGRIVEAAFSGCELDIVDPMLAGLPLSDLLGMAHMIGVAALTPADEDELVKPQGAAYRSVRPRADACDVASMAAVTEAAVPFLRDWSSYEDLLVRVAGRNPHTGSESADAVFATRIGQSLRRPPRGIDGIPNACMIEAVENFCETRHGIKPRAKSVRRDSPVARRIERHLSRERIARELGVKPGAPALRRIYEDVVRGYDAEGLADMPPKILADRVEREVVRRWNVTHRTMSTHEAVKHLNHPSNTNSPDDWIRAELLVPVDPGALGIDNTLTRRRRGISFLASDVEALRDRIASNVCLVNSREDLKGYETSFRCRKFHGAGWPRSDFLLAFLGGRVPARSLVARPRICDVWFHLDTVRDLSLEYHLNADMLANAFSQAHRCRRFLTELWNRPPEYLTDYHLRHLRRTGAVRYHDVRNYTEGRERPRYEYSVMDLVERAWLIQGPSRTPLVDSLIKEWIAAKAEADRIRIDDEQRDANEYLSNLAEHVRISLSGQSPGGVRPNPGRTPPKGWRQRERPT